MSGVLDPAGPQAARIAAMFTWYLAILGAVYAAVLIATALAVIRGRKQTPADDATATHGPSTARHLRWAVIGATSLSVLLLFALLIGSVSTSRALSSLAPAGLTIELTGQQWWWEVTYPHAEPSKHFTTANEIHVPAGKPVLLHLRSRDVIHSFWVPQLHGKRDMIPGRDTWLVIQADEPGVYRGRCAELCGYQHAHMALSVVAQPEREFARWLEQQRAPAREPINSEQRRGHELFTKGSCAMCHSIRGTTAAAQSGPDLTHLASRRELAAGALPNTRDALTRWIRDSQSIKPGSYMPAQQLGAADLRAVVAYLETLR
jgi:cytochrome c oxidase subunit 2